MMADLLRAAPALHVAFYMHDLSGGGVERMRLSLIAALRARGISVSLVVGARQGALVALLPPDLTVFELGARRTILAIPRLAAFLRETQPDVLVSSLDHNNIAAMVACVVSGSGTRLVVCQHNALSAERKMGWKYRLVPLAYRLLHRAAHAIVAVSDGVGSDLAATARVPGSKITVIYNPVIGADFFVRSAGPAPHPWLAEKGCKVFVFCGRLTAQKDVFTLLAAMEILLQRLPTRLILLGEGEDEAGLRRFARQHGIAHAVAFAGFQPNPLPWIRHADALVSSSRYEGLGNAIVEALGCGTPVIATDCPYGPAELLLGGAIGRLVPVADAHALADAMEAHGRAGVDTPKMQARAAQFTDDACAEAHLSLFRRIMIGRGRIVHALGMDLSPLPADRVADLISAELSGASLRLMVTPNLDHVRLLRMPDFAAAYASAHLVCPDGLPVLLYARFRGLKLRSRVTGCDVFALLMRQASLRAHRLFFVVESRETEAAAAMWAEQLGLADRIGIWVAPPDLGHDETAQSALVRAIGEAGPSILVMTLGAPVSEVFVHSQRHALPPCWALCVGQALRVELKLVQRAPLAWRQFGMEWLWRLRHEPRRLFGRYARSLAWFPVAIWHDLAEARQTEKGKSALF